MESFLEQPNNDRESGEALPLFSFSFYNNHEEIYATLAPNMESAIEYFSQNIGRPFGSVEGDSVTSVPAKDVIYLE